MARLCRRFFIRSLIALDALVLTTLVLGAAQQGALLPPTLLKS